jgi:hypothetical protein
VSIPPELRTFDLRAIISAIVKINIYANKPLGDQICKVLSDFLGTDRITFALIDHNTNQVLVSYSLGFRLPHGLELTAGKLMTKALAEGKPQVYGNVRDYPDLTAMWADDYRTNACCVLPVIYQGIRMGALCMSNLTEAQTAAMRVQTRELELFGALMGLISAFQAGYLAAKGDKQMQLVVQRLNLH